MIIYLDALTKDECLTDSHVINELKEYNGAIISCQSKLIKIGGESINTGANAATEQTEDDESYDDTAVQVINIVHAHKLQPMKGISKDEYKTLIKAYIGNLKAKLSGAALEKFNQNQKPITEFVKSVLKQFDEYTFYVTERASIDQGMLILARYPDGADAPIFYYFADGLYTQKV